MEKVLNGEINAATGYAKQRCLALCMALVAYNVMSTVKGAVRVVHGETKVEKLSGFYLADEIQMCHRGMMKAIPKDEWVVFQAATTIEFAEVMKVWARSVPLEEYASNPRAKETKAEEAERRKDKTFSTFRILKARKVCTT